jgi:myosin heavy subunit
VKDLQGFQQVQIDTLKDSAQFSASNIKTLERKLKGLQRRGNQRSKTPRMEDVEETGLQEDLSADTIESQSESANVMPKGFEGDGHSLEVNDEALDPAAPNTRGANFEHERAEIERKWSIALEYIKEGRERMQQMNDWLQTTNKAAGWWRAVLTPIESLKSVRQAVGRINKTVYERRMAPGNGVFRGVGRNRYGVFEVMMEDLKTAVGVLT